MRTRKWLLLPAIAVGVVIIAGCTTTPTEPTDKSLVVAAASDSNGPGWGPENPNMSAEMVNLVYEGLFRADDLTQEITPLAAESYEWDESRTVLSVVLREGMTFTDGTAFDAEAVRVNYQWYADRPDNIISAYFAQVTDLTVTGDLTFDVALVQPDPFFIPLGGTQPIYSPAALEAADGLVSAPVGSGPYVLDVADSVVDSEYVFTRNPDFRDPDAYAWDTVTVKFILDVTARVNALKSGQVDFAPIDASTVEDVDAAGFTITQVPWIWLGLALDPRPGAITSDLRVRQALEYAIDRDAIHENVERGYGLGGNQVWTEGQAFYRPDRADEYAYDPEKAKELLAEAGYPDGFALTMPTFSGWLLEPYQPAIQQNLADIGVTVTFEVTTVDETVAGWNGDLNLPVVTFLEAYPIVLPQVIYPTGVHNNNDRWGTDQTSTRLIAAITTGTEQEAAEASAELGDYVLDQAWFVVVGQPTQIYAHIDSLDAPAPLKGAGGGGIVPAE